MPDLYPYRDAIKHALDLREFVKDDWAGDVWKTQKGGQELRSACPFCGNGSNKRSGFAFRVTVSHYKCHACGVSGDWMQYIQARGVPAFGDALRVAGQFCGVAIPDAGDTQTAPPQMPQRPEFETPPKMTPNVQWMGRARLFADRCSRYLFDDVGQTARAYLNGRGLLDDTLAIWGVGFNPKPVFDTRSAWGLLPQLYPSNHKRAGQPRPLWLPRGVVFVYELPDPQAGHPVWRLKVRLLPRDLAEAQARGVELPKVVAIEGSAPAVFMAASLTGEKRAIITEGEIDALHAWQATGGAYGVATTGGTGDGLNGLNLKYWGRYFYPLQRSLICFDADGKQGTERGARAWVNSLHGAQRLRLQMLRVGDTDINDYISAGGDFASVVKLAFDVVPR